MRESNHLAPQAVNQNFISLGAVPKPDGSCKFGQSGKRLFRTPDVSLAATVILLRHSVPFIGCERNGNGGVVFVFEDLRHERPRIVERWLEARQRLRRAARAAQQQQGDRNL